MDFMIVFTILVNFNAILVAEGHVANHSVELKAETALSTSTKQRSDILANYRKQAVPVRPIIVKLHILLMKIKAPNEKDGIFESVIALFIEWWDKRISWDPEAYNNLTHMSFDSTKVWIPDIAMINSADHYYTISRDSQFLARVSFDGLVKFVPTGTARTWCDLNLLTFPFDFQECKFQFESWTLNSAMMTFDSSSAIMLDDKFGSVQFFLCQLATSISNRTYKTLGETFTRIEFSMIVKRKSTFYVINLIFPCVVLSIVSMFVFAIPLTDTKSNRHGFAITNLLSLVVFQTISTAELPKTNDAVTALSKYIMSLITISAFGIVETGIVERVMRIWSKPPPKWLWAVLEGIPCFDSANEVCTWKRLDSNNTAIPRGSSESLPQQISGSLSSDESGPCFETNHYAEKLEAIRLRRKAIREKNNEMWRNVASKIECIVLLSNLALVFLIPMALFMPLFLVDDRCSDSMNTLQELGIA